MTRTANFNVRSHAAVMPMGRDDPSWPDTQRMVRGRDDLLSPRTQIVADRDAYLGQGASDIGRRVSEDQVELFITGDIAQSLQQEFVQHRPEYIALHDVGASASLRLLASLAGGAGARVQRLSIRRQGHGVALAVLQFVEVPLADDSKVRVYSSDVSVDAAQRAALARVLLAHSRLGVLMVGPLQPNALVGQLAPLHEALLRGPWPNRDLLMVPLGSGITLAGPAAQLGAEAKVAVHVTPHASKPRHAWNFIGGAWNRLHAQPGGERAISTDISEAVPRPSLPSAQAPTEPMPLLDPRVGMPEIRAMPMPVPGGTSWSGYVQRCAAIKGAVACCVFDLHSLQVMAASGQVPSSERLARQGALLLSTAADSARALGTGSGGVELSVSTNTHHLLLRQVPGHPGVAVHLVLQASGSNLTLARLQLERVEAPG